MDCRRTSNRLLAEMVDGGYESALAEVAGRTSHNAQAAATYPYTEHSHTAQDSSTEGMVHMQSQSPWTVYGRDLDPEADVASRPAAVAARCPLTTQTVAGSRTTAGGLPKQRMRPKWTDCCADEWTALASDRR